MEKFLKNQKLSVDKTSKYMYNGIKLEIRYTTKEMRNMFTNAEVVHVIGKKVMAVSLSNYDWFEFESEEDIQNGDILSINYTISIDGNRKTAIKHMSRDAKVVSVKYWTDNGLINRDDYSRTSKRK